jgi:hypothetical protein
LDSLRCEGQFSGSSEWIAESNEIAWRIETLTNLSDQIADMMSLTGDPSVTFASSNMRWNLASRLHRAHSHDRLHLNRK